MKLVGKPVGCGVGSTGFQPCRYPHLLPSHSSPNQLATRVTLPFMGGSESGLVRLGSGEGLGTSLDEAMARRHLGVCMSILADHYANRPISNRRRLSARLTRSEANRAGSPLCDLGCNT
jgi:hypothetical protein